MIAVKHAAADHIPYAAHVSPHSSAHQAASES
jgi:hypothetical protein